MTSGLALPAIVVIAAAVVVPTAIARRQWALTIGVTAAGAGLVLQAPPVYGVVDPLLGDRNVTNLGYHLLTVIGIAALLVLVLSAGPSRDQRRDRRVVGSLTALVCLLQAALFAVGSATAGWGALDPHLTEAIATPLFVGYAAVLWFALAGLACAAIVAQRAQTRGRPWSVARAGTTLVAVGSVAALFWCANAIALAVIATLHHAPGAVDRFGPGLALVSGGAVFAGLAMTNLPHVAARANAVLLDVQTRPLWRRAVASAPEVALPSSAHASLGGRATLYRRWVEIEDAVRLERLQLSDRERERLATMQRMFAPDHALSQARRVERTADE